MDGTVAIGPRVTYVYRRGAGRSFWLAVLNAWLLLPRGGGGPKPSLQCDQREADSPRSLGPASAPRALRKVGLQKPVPIGNGVSGRL